MEKVSKDLSLEWYYRALYFKPDDKKISEPELKIPFGKDMLNHIWGFEETNDKYKRIQNIQFNLHKYAGRVVKALNAVELRPKVWRDLYVKRYIVFRSRLKLPASFLGWLHQRFFNKGKYYKKPIETEESYKEKARSRYFNQRIHLV